MDLVVLIPAGRFSRWTEEAAKSLIGKTFKATEFGKDIGEGKVLKAAVVDERRAMEVTIDWPKDIPFTINVSEFSFGQNGGAN